MFAVKELQLAARNALLWNPLFSSASRIASCGCESIACGNGAPSCDVGTAHHHCQTRWTTVPGGICDDLQAPYRYNSCQGEAVRQLAVRTEEPCGVTPPDQRDTHASVPRTSPDSLLDWPGSMTLLFSQCHAHEGTRQPFCAPCRNLGRCRQCLHGLAILSTGYKHLQMRGTIVTSIVASICHAFEQCICMGNIHS